MDSTRLTGEEVQNSLTRLQEAFYGNYGPSPITEGSRTIGCMSTRENTIYLTFRGSIGSLTELLSCLDMRKSSAEKWGLSGKVHAGLHTAFSKVQHSIDTNLSHLDLSNMNIVVEGYSRGSALAMLTAAHLAHRVTANRLKLITYSPMNIFDKAAAHTFQEKIPNQWNFVCKGDFLPRWIGPPCLGFFSSGRKIEFSPEDSPSFLDRVERKAYTHLISSGFIGRILRFLIPIRLWEIHMPETYDGSLVAIHTHSLQQQAHT